VDRLFLLAAAIGGFVGVAFGAFGAHALQRKVTPERLVTFETGVRYLFVHALALGLVVAVRTWAPDTAASAVAGLAFIVGMLLFSGSLFLLVWLDKPKLGAITPIGGVALLIGWGALAVAVLTADFVFGVATWWPLP
jgi:uncharacterized membrane protein YgdD (TMEM256/DUF423 family)